MEADELNPARNACVCQHMDLRVPISCRILKGAESQKTDVNGEQANSYTKEWLRGEILCQALAQRKRTFGQGKRSQHLLNAFTTKRKGQLLKINICNKHLKGRNAEGKYTS